MTSDEGLKIIKKIEPQTCPHCQKAIFISTQSVMPSITSLSSKIDIDNAKNAVKLRLDDVTFADPKEKKDLIDWLENEETFITFEDVESLIHQISTDQCEKIQEKAK